MMVTEFKGKILVRRAKTNDGKPVLVIVGVVETNANIETFDPRDEMWAAHLIVNDSIKFINDKGTHFSPEDFLENANGIQDAKNWKKKD